MYPANNRPGAIAMFKAQKVEIISFAVCQSPAM